MKSITIGIITFNGAHRVHNLLRSIEKWNDVPSGYRVHTVLVDDGSTGGKRDESLWVATHHQVPLLPHNGNKGISKGWNDCCNYADSNIIVLLNDDILVAPNWLTCMTHFLDNNPHAAAVGWSFYFIVSADI